jgi:hypothetical protein
MKLWPVIFILMLLSLTSCSQLPAIQQARQLPHLPAKALLTVPFFAQAEYQCGPAALAMVLTAAGKASQPEQLVSEVYLPNRQGSLATELKTAIRQRGLLAYPAPERLSELLERVSQGQPVLVFLNMGLSWYPVWHYAVVVGFDRQRELLFLHSGQTQNMAISWSTFERTWQRTGHWGLIVLPPTPVPLWANPQLWLSSSTELGHNSPPAAEVALVNATQLWPNNPEAWLKLGNLYQQQQQLHQAELQYLKVLKLKPHSIAGLNNLAHNLSVQGRKPEASRLLCQALKLAPNHATLKQTQLEQSLEQCH